MTTNNKSYFNKMEKRFGPLSFGEMLKSWRQAEGLSQAEFARDLQLSSQNLNDLEKGRRIPTPTRAAKIAKKLGLPELSLIQLSIRDSLAKEGFRYEVKLKVS